MTDNGDSSKGTATFLATVAEDTHPIVPSGTIAFSAGVQVADRFLVTGHLGRGSSGEVLSVQDLSLDREVAMKVLRGAGGPTIARFMREARITAKLDHPNVPPVHALEFLPDGGLLFTMRKLDGMTLGEALRRTVAGDPPAQVATVNVVVNLAQRVCDALSRAHFLGIIHRDVKPDNIMLGSHGEVALVDWGECRLLDEPDHGPAGSTVGTPAYMSPEQARGEPADQQSDVYGVGATIWHLLSRQPPTWHDEPATFWEKKRQGVIDPLPPLAATRMPRQLQAILLRALAPRAVNRYESAVAMAADLERFQAGQSIAAYRESAVETALRWVRQHRGLLLAVTVVLLVAGIGAGLLWREQQRRIGVWGEPVLVESFVDDSWRSRWVQAESGSITSHPGSVQSEAPHASFMILKQTLSGSVAIEYDGWYEPGARPGDLSVIWTEAPGVIDNPELIDKPATARRFWIQAGAYDNYFCSLVKYPDEVRLDKSSIRIDPGSRHRFRVELDGREISMWLDGRRVLHYEELLPIATGHLGFYFYYPGKAISNVRVYQKQLPEETSVLALGDVFLDHGEPDIAYQQYRKTAESHHGTSLAAEATYRQGYIHWLAGRSDEAMADWSSLTTGVQAYRVEAHRMQLRFDRGDIAEACKGLVELRHRQPAITSQLQSQLANWAKKAQVEGWINQRVDDVESILAAKSSAFRDAGGSDLECGQMMLGMGRTEAALRLYPGEPYVAGYALIRLGRPQEAYDQFQNNSSIRGYALLAMGRLDEFHNDPWLANLRGFWPPVLSESYKAPAVEPVILIRTGHADQVLAGTFDEDVKAAARWTLDLPVPQLDPAPGDFPPQSWSIHILRLATGKQALATVGENPGDLALGWALVESARQQDSLILDRLRQRTVQTWPDWHAWLPWMVLEPLAVSGPVQMRERLETVWNGDKQNDCQRPWHLAGYALGHLDNDGMETLPCSREIPLWIALGDCLRAELSGQAGAISAAWKAFNTLPRYQRLSPEFLPIPGLERLAAWRLGQP